MLGTIKITSNITENLILFSLIFIFFLTGCNTTSNVTKNETVTNDKPFEKSSVETQTNSSPLIGCYTVIANQTAQIKVSPNGNELVMQMREPSATATELWDSPEPLENINRSKINDYFSIDPKRIDAIVGRADGALVLAHVSQVYPNVNPKIDSEYLSYIYVGANTIYKIDCNEYNVEPYLETV